MAAGGPEMVDASAHPRQRLDPAPVAEREHGPDSAVDAGGEYVCQRVEQVVVAFSSQELLPVLTGDLFEQVRGVEQQEPPAAHVDARGSLAGDEHLRAPRAAAQR